MDDEAFIALEAVGRAGRADLPEHEHWIKAFKAIRWVVQTEAGLTLTPAGQQARDEFAKQRQSRFRAKDWRDQRTSDGISPGK